MNNDRLYIYKEIKDKIISYSTINLPQEACGLLVGQDNWMSQFIEMENVFHSKYRFEMEPNALMRVINWLERQKMNLLGIMHSHPAGGEKPSQEDIERYYYPQTAMIICSMGLNNDWKVSSYQIRCQKAFPIQLDVIENQINYNKKGDGEN